MYPDEHPTSQDERRRLTVLFNGRIEEARRTKADTFTRREVEAARAAIPVAARLLSTPPAETTASATPLSATVPFEVDDRSMLDRAGEILRTVLVGFPLRVDVGLRSITLAVENRAALPPTGTPTGPF